MNLFHSCGQALQEKCSGRRGAPHGGCSIQRHFSNSTLRYCQLHLCYAAFTEHGKKSALQQRAARLAEILQILANVAVREEGPEGAGKCKVGEEVALELGGVNWRCLCKVN